MRLQKNFQPVGVSKKGRFRPFATRSRAAEVGMERATPCSMRACMQLHLAVGVVCFALQHVYTSASLHASARTHTVRV